MRTWQDDNVFATRREVEDAPSYGHKHGERWSQEDKTELERYVRQGMALVNICKALGRSASGVIPKAQDLNLIQSDWQTGNYIYHPDLIRTTATTKEQETMSQTAANIETIVMIQGQNAAGLSDERIFDLIATLEAKVDKLNAIRNKPATLKKLIDNIGDDIVKLMEYVDRRAEGAV